MHKLIILILLLAPMAHADYPRPSAYVMELCDQENKEVDLAYKFEKSDKKKYWEHWDKFESLDDLANRLYQSDPDDGSICETE